MEIGKQSSFLVLKSDPTEKRPRTEILSSLSSAIKDWSSGTRVSPIWSLGKRVPKSHAFEGPNQLIFLGPVAPAKLFAEVDLRDRPGNLNSWVTLGTYDLVLRMDETASGENALSRIRSWARRSNIASEEWKVKDGVVTRWKAHPLALPRAQEAFNKLAALAKEKFPSGLNIHAQEFIVLMSSALSRAATLDQGLQSDLILVADHLSHHIREVLETAEDELLDVSAQIINMNAALSRFTSQAFSGISPVAATECHFWIHSLLGTGSANFALANLVRFITSRLGRALLPERFAALKSVTAKVPTYNELVSDKILLWQDYIGSVQLDPTTEKEPLQPMVTYFSGRDGYNSQLQTLSAPLTCISQANSVGTNW
jgi:hypothetical protein